MLHRLLVMFWLITVLPGCYTNRSLLDELKVERYAASQLPALQLSIDRTSLENAYLEQIVEESYTGADALYARRPSD